MSQTADMSQRVIDNLMEQNLELEAKLSLIGDKITSCCSHPWTPTTQAILNCLYPTRWEIEQRMLQLKQERGANE